MAARKKKVAKKKKAVTDVPLNKKQLRFVDEYLIDLNGKQAAIRAGYSPRTAEMQASRLLSKDKVKAAVQERMDKRSERTEITQDRVLKEIARIAFLDIRQAFNERGELLEIPDMPEDVARAIGGMDVSRYTEKGEDGGTETTKKIKLIDKKGALELLGRNLKLFTDQTQITFVGDSMKKAMMDMDNEPD